MPYMFEVEKHKISFNHPLSRVLVLGETGDFSRLRPRHNVTAPPIERNATHTDGVLTIQGRHCGFGATLMPQIYQCKVDL